MVAAHEALIADVNPARLVVSTRLAGMERTFMTRGMDAASAHGAAVRAMAGAWSAVRRSSSRSTRVSS